MSNMLTRSNTLELAEQSSPNGLHRGSLRARHRNPWKPTALRMDRQIASNLIVHQLFFGRMNNVFDMDLCRYDPFDLIHLLTVQTWPTALIEAGDEITIEVSNTSQQPIKVACIWEGINV